MFDTGYAPAERKHLSFIFQALPLMLLGGHSPKLCFDGDPLYAVQKKEHFFVDTILRVFVLRCINDDVSPGNPTLPQAVKCICFLIPHPNDQ